MDVPDFGVLLPYQQVDSRRLPPILVRDLTIKPGDLLR
jgi:hypothetical protein